MRQDELAIKLREMDETFRQTKAKYYLQHFYEFNRDVVGWPDCYEPLHRRLCEFVQDNIRKKKLLILLPRGSFKSSMITVGYSLWRIAKNPQERVLLANATFPMACQFLSQIKDHLSKNEKFKELYGDLSAMADSWREDRITVAREGLTAKEPTVWAFGMGTNVTGSHYSVAILDDMVNRDNITTRDQIDKVINFYRDTLDLVDPIGGKKQVIIIGTTWHQSDLYSWIQDPETNILQDFKLLRLPAYTGEWKKGKLLFPPVLSWDVLAELKRQQGTSHFCTPAESPVIMGDLSVKPIVEVKKGDTVVGWNQNGSQRATLVKSEVKEVFEYDAEVMEMKMESGRIVRCTPEHKWYSARSDKTHNLYRPAQVGSRLMFMFDPEIPKLNRKQQQLAHWLGGFFDADGSCGSGYNSVAFHQDSIHNSLIWNKLKKVFEKLNFGFSSWEKTYDTDNPRFRHKSMYWLTGGKQIKMDFLNLCKPYKKERILRTVFGKTNFIQERDRVVSIKSIGKKKVYALEIETGNYIVWGYGSSNSAQYMLDPVPLEDAVFKAKFKYYEETDIQGLQLNKFIMVDPALSERKEADYSAMVCVGVDKNNDWYILDLWRDQVKPKRLLDQMFYWNDKWKPTIMAIETTAFQKVLQYFAYEEMKRRNKTFPIHELKHTDRSKDERIRGLEPRYEMGSIFHNKSIPYNDHLEDELRRFPRGKNDDMVDALAGGLEVAYPPKQVERKQNKFKRNTYPA